MNATDRSIALLDTSLGRHFQFIEMIPDLTCLENNIIDANDLVKFLKILNKRIEYLYDRDHTIGPNINNFDDLHSVMKNKIIPLLQEYFCDNWEKIQIVLGDHKKQNKDPNDRFIISEEVESKIFLNLILKI